MIKHTFSDFSYAVNTTSAKKGYKEIFCCFIYNGTEVLRKVYIKESKGTAYIFEAKKIIDQEVRDGSLTIYSRNFIKKHKRVVPTKKSTYAASLVKAGVSDLPKGKGTLKKKKTTRKPTRKKPVAHKKKAAPKAIAPVAATSIAASAPKKEAPAPEEPTTEMVEVSDNQSPKDNNKGRKWAIAGCALVAAAGITVGSIFLAKALREDVTTYKVTFAGEHYTVNGKTPKNSFVEREKGEKIGTIEGIKADATYTISSDEIVVQDIKKEDYTWDQGKGTIKFKDSVVMPEKNIQITITPKSTGEYKISFAGEGFDVYYGESETPVTDINLSEGDPIEDITVEAKPYYVLDKNITIDPKVVDDPKITGDEQELTISFNGQTMPGESFKISITAKKK